MADKLFLVTQVFRSYGRVLVEAPSKERAREIADQLDGSDFIPDDDPYGGESDIHEVAEVKSGSHPELPIVDGGDVEA